MNRPVLTVRSDDSIEQATALLTTNDVTSAPVVDASGVLVGMVSEGDLMQSRVSRPNADPHARPKIVSEVMTKKVVAMPPDAELADVAEAMLANNIRSVPIIDDAAELTGIISRRDILRSVVRTDDTAQLEIQHRLDDYAGGESRWTATVHDGVAVIAGHFDDAVEQKIVDILTHTVPGVTSVELRPSG